MTTSTVPDKKVIMRDKRAQGIAAMGLVNREGERFLVTTPTLRGRHASYEVWRDEAGKVRCSCLEFAEQSAEDAGYRCEHILAVKHSLLQKTSEAVTKQTAKTETVLAAPTEVTVPDPQLNTPNTQENNASEKRVESSPTTEINPVAKKRPRFAREHIEPVETTVREEDEEMASPLAGISVAGSLAKHTTEEEQGAMSKTPPAPVVTVAAPENDLDFVTAEEHAAMTGGSPIVPLAFTNTLRTLRQPIDARFIKTREGWTDHQGHKHLVEYVEWHTVADLLDRIVPTWSHAVRNIVQIGDMVAVTAALTIDGVTREGVGTGTAGNETGIKKAEHDALKRAAIKFGIARDLYQRESEVIENTGATQAGGFPSDPLAKSMADLVTPKQLGMIRALAREVNVDVDEECLAKLRCQTEELSKRAASSFIDHLKSLQQQAAADGMRRAS